MNRTRKQWQKANADDLSKFANQAFHAITNAKADIEELHDENARLRAKLAALVEAGQDALNVIWVENLVAKEEGNIRYEATTKAVYDKLQAALAAAEGGANGIH